MHVHARHTQTSLDACTCTHTQKSHASKLSIDNCIKICHEMSNLLLILTIRMIDVN